MQFLDQIKDKNPHKEGSKDYVDFVFQNNFSPEVHPEFFNTYDRLIKDYKAEWEPYIVFGQLNQFIVKKRSGATPEEILKTPEGFHLVNYDNSILLSFLGMNNTLFFPLIQ
jgi:hypothetical protein